jgi:hypothetical protein
MLSRRSILRSGAITAAAGVTAPLFSGWAGPLAAPAGAAALPVVTPKWSQLAVQSFGVCAMPLHNKTAYRYRSAWIANLDSMGIHYIRSFYQHGAPATYETVSLLRQRGMKWGMGVISEHELAVPDSVIVSRVNDIAKRAADVCLFIEGINEPNHNRDGSRVRTDWRELTLRKQKVLWQAVQARPELRGRVAVLGPSLQMVQVSDADYKWFADRGLPKYMTHAGSHAYSGGKYPDRKFGTLLAPMTKYWKKPIWVTETGFTNSVAGPKGPSPVPEWVSGVYAPSAVLEAIDRNWNLSWFEALDDPDGGAKNLTEANYGLYALQNDRMAPPWRAKPAATALKSILAGMKDPGPTYRPASMGLRVAASTPDVRWTALGKRDGSVRLYLRRAIDVYDAKLKRTLPTTKVSVKVTTAKGTRTVSVGPEVVTIVL